MKSLATAALITLLAVSSAFAKDYSSNDRYIGLAATGIFAIVGHRMPANLVIYALKEARYEPQTHLREALHAYMDFWYRMDHEQFDNSFVEIKKATEASVLVSLLSIVNNCHGRDTVSGGDELSRIINEAQNTLDSVNRSRANVGMAPEPEAVINDGCR